VGRNDADQFEELYSIIHFTVPQMIKQKSGRLFDYFDAAQRGEAFHTHYVLRRRDVSLTKGLAMELARHVFW